MIDTALKRDTGEITGQQRTLNLLGDMRRLSSFCASMAVPSMPSSPYRNCTTLPLDVRTVPSYLQHQYLNHTLL